jgi:hypothetical protein
LCHSLEPRKTAPTTISTTSVKPVTMRRLRRLRALIYATGRADHFGLPDVERHGAGQAPAHLGLSDAGAPGNF